MVIGFMGFFIEYGNVEQVSVGFIKEIFNKVVVDYIIIDNSEFDFVYFCFDFFFIIVYFNDLVILFIDIN